MFCDVAKTNQFFTNRFVYHGKKYLKNFQNEEKNRFSFIWFSN